MNRLTTTLIALATTASLTACTPNTSPLEEGRNKDLDKFAAGVGSNFTPDPAAPADMARYAKERDEAEFCDAAGSVLLVAKSEPGDYMNYSVTLINKARTLKPQIAPELRRRGFTQNEVNRFLSMFNGYGGGFWRVGDRKKYTNCYEGEAASVAHVSSYSDTMHQYGRFGRYSSPTYVWFSGQWSNGRLTDFSS